MESQSKELSTKSTENSLKLLDEEEDVFDETGMGSIIDLIYQTWITNTFVKNLRMMIGCIQTYMMKQRKIDPNTIRMRKAKIMKDALMSFLESLKMRGLLNSMYSMEELNRFFSTPESKEYVRCHMATLSDAPNIDCEIFTSSAEVKSGGMNALFASTSKQQTDEISQYITKLENGYLYIVGTPEGQTGHQLIQFIVDKRFVVKEVAVLKNGTELTYYIFTCPKPWRFLTKADQSHASWMMTHHHGLRWNDGMVPYRTAQRLISEAVGRESGTTVYVKGFEKRGWLLNILNNDDVIVETIDVHYGEIESLKTLDATNTYRC
ncbi:hypothetical protein ALC57_09860 [Trachymyrmex cornetzi]|uniref:Uncharacterized protein n=1 Tax=Trachymyrmex cornetzi TaxID=471704 RepID=A0A151J523_9HYME|nr:hypothetical protein ALC57_09860 [Trachymyrmex cornetzi]